MASVGTWLGRWLHEGRATGMALAPRQAGLTGDRGVGNLFECVVVVYSRVRDTRGKKKDNASRKRDEKLVLRGGIG